MAVFSATGGRAPPRRRTMGRPKGWTLDKQRHFLNLLQSCLNVCRAADSVGLSARSAYQLKHRDAAFARGWAEALDIGYSDLELHLLDEATHGSTRTEIVSDAETGKVKQVKTVHSQPHGMAVRLMLAHQREVSAFRKSEDHREDDEVVFARIKASMEKVRDRLERTAPPSAPAPGTAAESGAGSNGAP